MCPKIAPRNSVVEIRKPLTVTKVLGLSKACALLLSDTGSFIVKAGQGGWLASRRKGRAGERTAEQSRSGGGGACKGRQ